MPHTCTAQIRDRDETSWLDRPLARWLLAALLFALAFIPRLIEPISRAGLWHRRSLGFYDALAVGNWFGTYKQHHPGVTTMWLSGGSINLVNAIKGASADTLYRFGPENTFWGVAPLALVAALAIVWAMRLLEGLFDRRTAIVAGFLLAIDPTYLAYSKVLHVDGLLTTFMFLSVLLLLRYVQSPRLPTLLLAGGVIGLSLLTKSPSLLLLPFAALAVAYAHYRELACPPCTPVPTEDTPGSTVTGEQPSPDREPSAGQGRARLLRWLSRTSLRGAALLLVVFATVFALFPALWVDAIRVAGLVYHHVAHHVENPHPNPIFYAGGLTARDPGFGYYLATLLFRSTFLTLSMGIVGAAIGLVAVVRRRLPERQALWGLVLFGLLFSVEMGVSGKKSQRYILPLFPLLDVLAAVGLVRTVTWATQIIKDEYRQKASIALIAFPILVQASIVLPYHPHYGLHANRLLGGPQVAMGWINLQRQAEGMELAGRFLAGLPEAAGTPVAVFGIATKLPFKREYRGRVQKTVRRLSRAGYRVYTLTSLLRGRLQGEEKKFWLRDRERKPFWAFERDGLTYAWIHKREADELKQQGGKREKRKGKKKRGKRKRKRRR